MKTFKKALAVFMCVVMVLCSAPLSGFAGLDLPSLFDFKAEAASYSGSCGDNVYWSLDTSTGVLKITGTGSMKDYSYSSDVPWASYRSNIKTVNIGSSVTSIGECAFYSCDSLTNITIPDSVTTIGYRAFYNCTSLADVTIGDGVTTIGSYAFESCTGLTSITVDENSLYYSSDSCGVLFNKDKTTLIQYPVGNESTSYTISDKVTTIGFAAFKDCSWLTSVTIPDSVTTIGDSAFGHCENLTSITIPDSVATIGTNVFYNCTALTGATIGNGVTDIYYGAFYNCTGLKELTMPASAKIDDESNTFYGCTNIEKVTLTKGTGIMQDYRITQNSLSSNTYYQYTPWYISRNSLKELVIEDGVTSIGYSAFYDCSGLTSVTIPDSVTTIGDSAFGHCENLTSITIPDSVTTIGNSAFRNCKILTSVTIHNSVTNICEYAFAGCGGLASITIPDSVTEIEKATFLDCTSLTNITIPDGVTNIDSYAFDGCSGLTSVTIPDSVTYIGICAFDGCSGLTSVTIPDSVTYINDYAFYNCIGLKELTMPASAEIYSSPFGRCQNIEKITLTKGSGKMCSYSSSTSPNTPWYVSQNNLKELVIEEGITNISASAFYGCSGLTTSITIPDSVTSIDLYAFYDCSGLTSVKIPDGVTNIGSYAFYGCSGLTSVTIPDGVTNIKNYAFYNCESLTDVYYGSTEDDWNKISIGLYNESLTNATIHYHYHSYLSYETTPVTCIQSGVMTYICDCGDNYTEIITPGHNYESVVTPNTCIEDGYTTHTCSVCSDTYTDSLVKSEGHKYNSVVTPNTCTDDGYTTHTCSVCGDTYTDSETKATGHSHESNVTKEPTCTNTGVRTFTCHCGDSYTEVIKANGHTKGEWEYIGGKEYAKSCTVCGDKLESKIVTVNITFNGENVNSKQILNKSTAIVTATVTDNFVNDLVFASSDSSTVSVDASGNVVANNIGKATITVTINGTAISDSMEVEVLPRDFTITWNVNGKQTKQTVKEEAKFTHNVNTTLKGYKFIGWDKTVPTTMPAENLIFTAQYELLVKQLKIKNPSVTTVNYGETLVLHADVAELPEGWAIQWTVEGSGFGMSPAADGLTCKVTSIANGNATVKATLVDENGEVVLDANGNEMSDSKQLTSKAGFWHKLVSFFKNLFGISRIILQSM